MTHKFIILIALTTLTACTGGVAHTGILDKGPHFFPAKAERLAP